VPGLVFHKGERVVSSFSWAFFDDGTGYNARLETAPQRPAWRDAYASARLVLPLARFVEGRAWFSHPSGRPMAVAGLYRLGSPRRAAMLTRPADDVVAPFHDRMPVILSADMIGPWLAGEPVPLARLLADSPLLDADPLTRPGPPPPEQPSLL
jgi:putative SOS response-associated peptidase YedK